MLDISNRFKMLDISKRFKIWYFEYILNVIFKLHSCTASNPPSLLWELQRYRTLCASVHEAMPLYQRWSLVSDRSGGISKLWRTPLKNGGGRECSWGRPDLEPQGDQGGEPRSWQQHHGSLCWGMEQQGEAHVNCAFAKLMTGQKQVQWISYKYLGTLICSLCLICPDKLG